MARFERIRRASLLIASAVLGLLALAALWPAARRPIEFLLYSIPANSILPLPHEPGVLYFSLFAGPLPLAFAGAVGAGLAALLDRAFVGWAFTTRGGQKLSRAPSWQRLTRLLLRAPTATVIAVSFTGFPPIQAVRLLVLSARGMTARRYALATALGRFPRFYLIALVGRALAPPAWIVGAVTLVFLAWPLVLLIRAPAPEPEPDVPPVRDVEEPTC